MVELQYREWFAELKKQESQVGARAWAMGVKWTEVERYRLCLGKEGLADVMDVGGKRNQGIKKTS